MLRNVAYIFALVLPGPLAAQVLLNTRSEAGKAQVEDFERTYADRSAQKLPCRVQRLKPMLNYAFRHQTGYSAYVPIKEISPRAGLQILFRVKPKGSDSLYYFRQNFRLRRLARRQGDLVLNGGFFLGEGEFDVDWLLRDNEGRVCREDWKVKLRLRDDEWARSRYVAAGAVAPLRPAGVLSGREEIPKPYRIAVLFHAAPLNPRSAVLTGFDQSLLLTTLVTLLDRTPFQETSITVFNLDRQDELFRTERLTRRSLAQVLEMLESLELGTVDVDTLANPEGGVELLAKLVNREQAADEKVDAVVFIGPNNRYQKKVPRELLEGISGPEAPLYFYLHQDFYARRFPFDDSIERLVKARKGKVFSIYEPRQLVKALRKMEEMLRENRPGATRS